MQRTTYPLRAEAPAEASTAGTRDQPEFARDPDAWFTWLRRAVRRPYWAATVQSIEPQAWTDARGHAWRIIRTAHGVEIRPELTNPFLQVTESLRVTALAVGGFVEVELTCRSGRWVDRFDPDTFDVGSLGQAMIAERELPHDNLPRLFPPRDE